MHQRLSKLIRGSSDSASTETWAGLWNRNEGEHSWGSARAQRSCLCRIWDCIPWGSSSACVRPGSRPCYRGYHPADHMVNLIHPAEAEAAFHRGCSVWSTEMSGGSFCHWNQTHGGTGCLVWRVTRNEWERFVTIIDFLSVQLHLNFIYTVSVIINIVYCDGDLLKGRMAKCTVQWSNQNCPWFRTKPSDSIQWSMVDLRLDLTWGGELSFLSKVQDLLVSNFRPELLRLRSTSSYGFSFSVEKTDSCLNKMTLMPQANVWREGLTLTKGMNRGQQRVPGAQLGLDIAAQERSESKKSRSDGWSKFFFFFFSPVTVSNEPTAHLKLLDTTWLVSQSPGMLNSLLWKTRRRFTFSGRDSG